MNEALKIIADIIGAVIAIAVAFIAPKVNSWLTEKVGESKAKAIYEDVSIMVQAAQQMFWDRSGAERKAYVISRLEDLGYTLTEELNALIESEVFKLHGDEAK